MEGESYFPSNSTEGDSFEANFCDKCYKQRLCTILINAVFGKRPKQWIYDKDYKPTCTSFNPNKQQYKRKDNNTLELF